MDEHTLRVLEFYKVRDILGGHAASEPGRARAESVEPSTDTAAVVRSLREAHELKGYMETGGDFPLSGLKDIKASLRKSRTEGAMLGPHELLNVYSTARCSRLIKSALDRSKASCPTLHAYAARLGVYEGLEEDLKRSIGDDGEILDSASSDLRRIRRGLTQVRARIQKELEKIIQDPALAKAVQEPVITMRGDRYVVPLKPNFKMYIKGIVHDHSTTRSTVFVEPEKTVELNNKLATLRSDEKREEERVLWLLTALVRESEEGLSHSLDALTELDAVYAKADYALATDAHMPEVVKGGALRLKKARHPLLMRARPKDTVPLDITLGEEYSTMVVTGPNTGGKTVALKTAGLLVLMAQSGMLIPAGPDSTVPVFYKVYSDIGDEQSVEQSLSTFSSHMTQIVRILEGADENSLVLLDEIGAGTDPAEGSALGVAIIEELHARGCKVIATTHHGALKVFAENTPGVTNASVEFDAETLQPTYRLLAGRPGRSNALLVAERLGMPKSVIESAKSQRGVEDVRLDKLIERLERESKAATEDRNRAALELLKARQEQAKLKEIAAKAEEGKNEAVRKARDKAAGVVRELRFKLRQLEEIEKKGYAVAAKGEARALAREVKELESELDSEELAPVPEKALDIAGLSEGDSVRAFKLGKTGTVLGVNRDRGKVVVSVGAMKLTLDASELEAVPGTGSKAPKRASTPVVFAGSSDGGEDTSPGLELNIVGKRVEEALGLLDRFLDDCLMAGIQSVRIIHGRGTGALRKAVAETLTEHRGVSSFKSAAFDEGGDAVTVVELGG